MTLRATREREGAVSGRRKIRDCKSESRGKLKFGIHTSRFPAETSMLARYVPFCEGDLMNVRMGLAIVWVLTCTKLATAWDACNCMGYAGPGGPCYAGPGGPAYTGPGGPAYAGPGGPCYAGPGGPRYDGPGGRAYLGPGGPMYDGPGGPAYNGPGGPAYSGPGGPCYEGPGGPCYSGPGGVAFSCPRVCN
jgi:hypothetical protein